jgi:hypothetical protein
LEWILCWISPDRNSTRLPEIVWFTLGEPAVESSFVIYCFSLSVWDGGIDPMTHSLFPLNGSGIAKSSDGWRAG